MNNNGGTRQCTVNTKRADILRGILKIRRKRNTSVSKANSRERSCLTQIVSSVSRLPGSCPTCTSPYDRSHKRRLVDSCGHERCYSCIGNNKKCVLCKEMGLDPGETPAEVPSEVPAEDPRRRSLAEHKRSRLETVLLPPPSPSSSPANTLPRRRKATRRTPADVALGCRTVPRLWSDSAHQEQQLPSPLYLEVAGPAGWRLTGRQWVWQDIQSSLSSLLPTNRGVIITGGPGSGKTAVILALVDRSCFAAPAVREAVREGGSVGEDQVRNLADQVVAYHFCQADNSPTCLVPEFVQSLAGQLCQAPQLASYHHLLQSQPDLLALLNINNCHVNPSQALTAGVLEPLRLLYEEGKVSTKIAIILIDGLCEAEQHRPDYGETLTTFLAKHYSNFPPWLKLVCTVRSNMVEMVNTFPFHRACLDQEDDERVKKDLSDYITARLSLTQMASKLHKNSSRLSRNLQTKFSSFLVTKAGGCFLYVKLVLDLVEKGSLSIKTGSFKVVPQNLSEIYQLVFNTKFPSSESYGQVSDIFSICLATLQPLTLEEIFTVLSALSVRSEVRWAELKSLYQTVGDVLVRRSDGSLMCFHPSLRDWLVRRREGDSSKFLCDLRTGHAALALSYSRQAGLSSERILGLTHHLLKSSLHRAAPGQSGPGPRWPHRHLQAVFTSLTAGDLSAALGSTKNIFSPILKVSRLLLLAGADPNTRTELEQSVPLVAAHSRLGHTDMVSLLLEYGADPNLADDVGQTALGEASAGGHLATVQLLLQCGARLGQTDLVSAVRGGHHLVVEQLLDLGQLSPHLLRRALSEAVLHSQPRLVEILLDQPDLRLEQEEEEGGLSPSPSPLEAAVRTGNLSLVRELVRRGAGLASVILAAAQQGDLSVLECLLAEGAGLDTRDGRGRTALMVASAGGHSGLLEVLVREGAGLEDTDQEGLTPLTHAVISGKTDIAGWLLAQGAKVNTLDCYNRSPLDVAIYQGQPAMVEILLDGGANMELPDVKGIKPLDRIIGYGNTEILSVFLRKGAKLGSATWAMARGKEEIQLILLNKLLDDGNTLYRQQRLLEASHRYRYALKRLTTIQPAGELRETFGQLETNLLLNLSRAERRRGNNLTALQLSSRVLQSQPQCVQALCTRAKAERSLGRTKEALGDFKSALQLVPENRELRRVILKLREGIREEMSSSFLSQSFQSSDSLKFIDESSEMDTTDIY